LSSSPAHSYLPAAVFSTDGGSQHHRGGPRRRGRAAASANGAPRGLDIQGRCSARPTSQPCSKTRKNNGVHAIMVLCESCRFLQGGTAPEGAGVCRLERPPRAPSRGASDEGAEGGGLDGAAGLQRYFTYVRNRCRTARRRCCLPVGRVCGEIRAAVARIPRAAADVFAICDAGGRAEARVAPKASV